METKLKSARIATFMRPTLEEDMEHCVLSIWMTGRFPPRLWLDIAKVVVAYSFNSYPDIRSVGQNSEKNKKNVKLSSAYLAF